MAMVVGLVTAVHMALIVCAVVAHECIHDSIQRGVTLQHIAGPSRGGAMPTATAPIRIVMLLDTLSDSTRYCTAAGEARTSYSDSSSFTCTAEGVLTAAKRTHLVDVVLPEVSRRLSQAVRVTPTTTPIAVPSTICRRSFTVSASAQSPGVSNADFVLVVSGMQTSGSTIAFAAACSLLSGNNRPIIGFANIGPNFINPSDTSDSTVRVMVHEVLHAMGFSGSFWSDYYPSGTLSTETRRDGTVTVVTAPAVVAAARTYFGCPTLTGPEIENEGGSGTASSHWERRTQYQDLMAGIIGDSRFSTLTLAMLEASGFYTANYSSAEDMQWGKDRGCGFFGDKCNTVSGGLGVEFCNDATADQCTFNRRGYGSCLISTFTADLPVRFQYFPGEPRKGGNRALMDYCPIVSGYSNRRCDDATSSANDVTFAEYFGTGGRCIETSGTFIQAGYSTSSNNPRRCMRVRCPGGTRVEIQLGSTWAQCPTNGAAATLQGTPYGYTGTFVCPAVGDICDTSLDVAESLTSTTSTTAAPATTTTAAPATTTTAAPATTTTAAPATMTTAAPTTMTTAAPATTTTAAPATSTTAAPTTMTNAAPSTTTTAAPATTTTAAPTTTTTTPPPSTTSSAPPSPRPVVVLLRAFVIVTAPLNFSTFVDGSSNAKTVERTRAAVIADLAQTLGLSPAYIVVVSLTLGSLRVDYRVVVPADVAVGLGAPALVAMQASVANRTLAVSPSQLTSLVGVVRDASGQGGVEFTSASSMVVEQPDVASSLAGLSPPSSGGLDGGAVAGVVIGSVVGAALLVVAIVAGISHCRRNTLKSDEVERRKHVPSE